MANVIVARKHKTGKFTFGIYLVDLYCLGIKNTMYKFNVEKHELDEIVYNYNSDLEHIEIDYNLAHNIIYAGHDFALEFDIKPMKDFEITKFILEEDNDAIELINIEVGDDEGKPLLLTYYANQYLDALDKLKKNAGEGNYNYVIEVDNNTNYNLEDKDYDDDDDEIDFDNPQNFEMNNFGERDILLMDAINEQPMCPIIAAKIDWTNKENITSLNGLHPLEKNICDVEINRFYTTIYDSKNYTPMINGFEEYDWIDLAERNEVDNNKQVENLTDLGKLAELLDNCISDEDKTELLKKTLNENRNNLDYLLFVFGMISFTANESRIAMAKNVLVTNYPNNYKVKLQLALHGILTANLQNNYVQLLLNQKNIFAVFPEAKEIVSKDDLLTFFQFKVIECCINKNVSQMWFYYHGIILLMDINSSLPYVVEKMLDFLEEMKEN